MTSLSERCAYHESGHAVAALAFSIPIVRVSIDTTTPHVHRARYRPPPGIGLESMACFA